MYRTVTLDNGLRLITAAMPHTRSVSVGFFIGAGSRYETGEQGGISHFIEHLCFKGTEKRPTARDICTAIEGVGGIFNGSTDKEITIYWSKVAQPYFPVALDVMADMLLNSKFDPVEMEKERQVIIEEISMGKDSPSQEVAILIDGLLFPAHPLGRDIAGTRQSVAAINRGMLLDYLAGQYQPGNAVLSIAGAIEHDEVAALVRRTLDGWSGGQPRPSYLPHKEQTGRRVQVETRDTEQVQLCLALPGLSLLDPARFTLDLLNVILGEGMSSRLFAEVRDRLGLAYSVYSYVEHFLDTGSVIISAGVEPKKLEVAIGAILGELAKLRETVSESELTKAKEMSKGRLLLSMEDSRNMAAWGGGQAILTGQVLSVDQIIAIIDAITPEDIQRLAGDLLVGDRLRLAVVGPVKDERHLEDLLKI